MKRSQSGNVLFLILIAVALFAALSYAVSSSNRTGSGSTSRENATLNGAAILSYVVGVDSGMQRLLASGFSGEAISLSHTIKLTNGSNYVTSDGNCTKDACRLFKPSGGGIVPLDFRSAAMVNPPGWMGTFPEPGQPDFILLTWPLAGTSLADVVLRFQGLQMDVCKSINDKDKISPSPILGGSYADAYTPSTWDAASETCDINCTQIQNKSTFGTVNAGYCNIYHLVLAR